MNLFDPKFTIRRKSSETDTSTAQSTQSVNEPLLLSIPKHASKQDLLDLKEFLGQQKNIIPLHIDLSGKVVDTKLGVSSERDVMLWAKKRWGECNLGVSTHSHSPNF